MRWGCGFISYFFLLHKYPRTKHQMKIQKSINYLEVWGEAMSVCHADKPQLVLLWGVRGRAHLIIFFVLLCTVWLQITCNRITFAVFVQRFQKSVGLLESSCTTTSLGKILDRKLWFEEEKTSKHLLSRHLYSSAVCLVTKISRVPWELSQCPSESSSSLTVNQSTSQAELKLWRHKDSLLKMWRLCMCVSVKNGRSSVACQWG